MSKKMSKTKIRQNLKTLHELNDFHFGPDPSLVKETHEEVTKKFIEVQSAGDSRRTLDKRMLSK